MPHTKSTIKRLRQSQARRVYNRAIRTRVRHLVRAVRAADPSGVDRAVTAAHAQLDRAANKGVVSRQAANRMKSRLAKYAGRLHGAQPGD